MREGVRAAAAGGGWGHERVRREGLGYLPPPRAGQGSSRNGGGGAGCGGWREWLQQQAGVGCSGAEARVRARVNGEVSEDIFQRTKC